MSTREPRIDPISLVGPEAITERQREVARLVAAGRTNTEIAQELGITLDGAKYHVSGLLVRLGLRRREEVAEWYRAHFGPVSRLRPALQGFLGLPAFGLAGGVVATGGVIAIVVFSLVAVRHLATEQVGPPEYVPFVQEWRIEGPEVGSQSATLEWLGCGEWRYELRDEADNVYTSFGDGPPDAEDGCHVPGVWFRPIDSFRGNPSPGYQPLGSFGYEIAYTRDCSEVSNPIEPDNSIGPDFCADPGGTFEDRVVVEFDPETQVPMRYSQYVDGVLSFEHRATSLRRLSPAEMQPFSASDR